jgi:hypothetical protein
MSNRQPPILKSSYSEQKNTEKHKIIEKNKHKNINPGYGLGKTDLAYCLDGMDLNVFEHGLSKRLTILST